MQITRRDHCAPESGYSLQRTLMRVCGSGGMGFIVSQVSEFRLGESGIGPAYSQRPAGAHEGWRIPGLRYASSGATIASSLREERRRVEVYRPPHLRIEMWATWSKRSDPGHPPDLLVSWYGDMGYPPLVFCSNQMSYNRKGGHCVTLVGFVSIIEMLNISRNSPILGSSNRICR